MVDMMAHNPFQPVGGLHVAGMPDQVQRVNVGSNRQTFGESGSMGNRLIHEVASEDYLVVGIVDD